MSKLNELIENSKAMSMNDRVGVATQATDLIITELKKLEISTDNISRFLVNIFKVFVSGDRKTRNAEYELFKQLFNLKDITTDEFFDITNYGSDAKFVEEFDKLIDSAPNDVAVAVATLGILIISADGEVTDAERALLEKILNR